MAAAPGQRVTLQCPVDPCGKSIKVTWCKGRECVDVIPTDNLEMAQTSSHKNHLLSSMTFKRISSKDAGLYKCYVNDNQDEEISHAISVNVSGMLGLNSELKHNGVII